jgi:hypothetical protein
VPFERGENGIDVLLDVLGVRRDEKPDEGDTDRTAEDTRRHLFRFTERSTRPNGEP